MYEKTGYLAEVMICGGNKNSIFYALADCLSLQPEVSGAVWTRQPDMPNARLMPEATLLPDGTVLFTNGMGWGQAGGNAGETNYAANPVFPTDLYNPVTNNWTTVGQSTIIRSYHNGAILLADGSVITTGSEMGNYLDFWGTYFPQNLPEAAFFNTTGVAKSNCFPDNRNINCTYPYTMAIEQFTPSYLVSGQRPVLVSLPEGTKFTYNSTIGLQFDSTGAPVTRITFLRYTTTTHSTNTYQRFIEPILLFVNSTYAVVRIPPTGHIAPPGNWHIFGISASGIPSISVTALFGTGDATSVPIPGKSSSLHVGLALAVIIGAALVVF
ncbi:hypothetical protein HK100_010783 [Physocladia obscura]|uniref:Galactose oxidase-like Early set domain-containing protein n=1 Tax=Physocladia obscura TaxID=109957 RepID=A0AAD5XDN7_9FUNG|nr:hypothetical protein HK100_010783 [Physocladia obscura]